MMRKKNGSFRSIIVSFIFLLLASSVLCGCAANKALLRKGKAPKITWDNERLYVNGEPYFIRGINYSDDRVKGGIRAASVEDVRKDVELLKDLNVNTVRLWDSPPHEILDIFYENGIMVMMQISDHGSYVGAWTDFRSKKELENYITIARQQVKRDKKHPAILMWCIWNDGPFGPDTVKKYSQKEMEDWLGEFAKAIKEEDPAHPITSANMDTSGYYDLGAGFLDILGFNNYAGLHGARGYSHAVTLRAFDNSLAVGRKYNKPVIITEAGKHTLSSPELQGKVIESLVDAARTRTTGIFIFQFADQWSKAGSPDVQDRNVEDYWGIVDRARNPKNGYLALKDAYAKIRKDGPEKADIEPYIAPSMPFPVQIGRHELIEDFEIDGTALKSKIIGIYTGESTLEASISDEKCWTGSKSLKLDYKANAINTWGSAVVKLDKPIAPDAKGVGLWVYRDGSLNGFRVQVDDQDRDSWVDYSIQLGEPGWVYYIVDFNNLERHPFGSSPDSNGIFDKGTVDKIIFSFDTVASPKSSIIYIDTIEVLY